MVKNLAMRSVLFGGSFLLVMATPLISAQAQNSETVQTPPGSVSQKTEEVAFVAPKGARFMIAGRTLLLVSLDNAPPAVIEGKSFSWDEYNTKLSGAAQAKFYHMKVPENKEAELRAQVVEEIILEKLLMNEAAKRGIKADETSIQQELDAVEKRYRGNEKWEQQRDRTLPKIRAEFVKRSTLALLEKQVREVTAPNNQQIRDFYEKNPQFFTEPVTQRVAVILLGVDPSAPRSVWDKAKNEAEGILKKINNGGDFAAIAKLRSTDTSASQGGDLGYVHQGMLSDEGQKVVDEMAIGQISEPIRILQGYAIFKLHDRTKERRVLLADSMQRAEGLYIRATAQQQWADLGKNLRAGADVTINPILKMLDKVD
ncbi:MAG: peptidylprolyl isomerase [Magnetovibrio sp.]|nr:peptidylprolyl isomerase [Magnetovibrio sp.]